MHWADDRQLGPYHSLTDEWGDDPFMTKEEGSIQLADAAWTLRGACKVSSH